MEALLDATGAANVISGGTIFSPVDRVGCWGALHQAFAAPPCFPLSGHLVCSKTLGLPAAGL